MRTFYTFIKVDDLWNTGSMSVNPLIHHFCINRIYSSLISLQKGLQNFGD